MLQVKEFKDYQLITIRYIDGQKMSNLVQQLETYLKSSQTEKEMRVIVELPSAFKGWKFPPFWESLISCFDKQLPIEKLAIIGGSDWIHWGVDLSPLLSSGDVQNFDDQERAKEWITAA